MKKIIVVLVVISVLIFIGTRGKDEVTVNENVAYKNTISISRTYVALRIKTDKLLIEASEYPDYNTWNGEMTKLINNWKNLEEKANKLEEQANLLTGKKISLKLIDEVSAYTKDEISNVFDNAPAGKKIRTLAKYLGVDAKRAYKILQNDQEFVKADAWNKAGDTFKNLETSATVIKDGCKVAGFVGGMVLTGGTAGLAGGVTIGKATVLVVTGTDLMLEVGEDTATIALGDQNKVSKSLNNIREVTDPLASILSLSDIPENIGKGAKLLDKIGVVLTEIDQIRSVLQDGKLLGINITPDSKIEVASLEKNEVKTWVKDNTGKETGYTGKDINDWLDDLEKELSNENKMKNKKEVNDDYKDLEEWLEGFENLDDWLDDFKDEDLIEDEEIVNIQAEESIDTGEGSESKEIKAEAESNGGGNKKEEASSKKAYTKDGKVSVRIASPHGALLSGQTQMWEIKVDGYEYYGTDNTYTGENRGYNCYWDFYTEYAPGVEPWMNMGSCKGIHAVPGKNLFVGEPSGELRAVVRVEFLEQNYSINERGSKVRDGKKVVETVTLEEVYEITPYFHHN